VTTKHDDDEPVMFGYASNRNISFHGQEESGFTWGEWRQMSRDQQLEAMTETVWELVDLYVEDDEDVAAEEASR
jgi:hypothetical protein